jgi:hypothetical protein
MSNYTKNLESIGRRGRFAKILAELGYNYSNYEKVKTNHPAFTFSQITAELARKKNATTRKAVENAAARKAVENAAARKAVENATARKAVENATARKATENAAARKAVENAAARKAANNEKTRLWGIYRTEMKNIQAEHKRSMNAKNAELTAKNAELTALRTQLARLKNSLRENEAKRRIARREADAAKEENIKLRERRN